MAEIKYKIIVSDRAKRMLGEHIAFIARINKTSAKETKSHILSSFHSLAEMPHRFPFFEEEYIPKNKYHKMLTEKRYLVLYQIKDDTVYIDYVIDCRQKRDIIN